MPADIYNRCALAHISPDQLPSYELICFLDGIKRLAKQKAQDVLSDPFVCELDENLIGGIWKLTRTFRRTEKNIGVDPIQVAIQLRQFKVS